MFTKALNLTIKTVAIFCPLLLNSCTNYYASYFVSEAAKRKTDWLSEAESVIGQRDNVYYKVTLVNSLAESDFKRVDSGMFFLNIAAYRKDDSTKAPPVKGLKTIAVTFARTGRTIVPNIRFEGIASNKRFPFWMVNFEEFHIPHEIDTISLSVTVMIENAQRTIFERTFEEQLFRVEYKQKGPPRGLFD